MLDEHWHEYATVGYMAKRIQMRKNRFLAIQKIAEQKEIKLWGKTNTPKAKGLNQISLRYEPKRHKDGNRTLTGHCHLSRHHQLFGIAKDPHVLTECPAARKIMGTGKPEGKPFQRIFIKSIDWIIFT
ncbi:hypothetical protein NQ317_014605 [Molorchus minor]|uniref:Uncharacterized protein n=1 Tax=Molorchus minor TaxID=1323400 RepID=A0ABQ9JMS7_9CUCU|nr:hypothetical protein NQ317_014605 [Molorchus minor]